MNVRGYEILGEITRDRGHVSYEARQRATGRQVALQVTLAGPDVTPGQRDAVRDRLAALALLDHPHVVPVLASGECDAGCYLVRPLLSAQTLGAVLRAAPSLPPPGQAARWVAQMADAVGHCHDHGIFGPLLGVEDVLIEAGEARLNTSRVNHVRFLAPPLPPASPPPLRGMPSDCCPEEIRGEGRPDDPRRDVWALGVLLYRTLTGGPPFPGPAVFEAEPIAPRLQRPEIAADLEAICLGCLRRKPEDRFPAVSQVAAALGAYLEGRPIGPVSGPAPSLASRMGRWVRGWWAPAATG